MSSVYGVGRQRGAWWKWKVAPLTLDAVLVYTQAGSGRRASLFTDDTFAMWRGDELVPIAKAYSGLTEREIAALDRWICANTVDRFGPVRQVEPAHVFELAFECIAPSTRHKSGVALRFPRSRAGAPTSPPPKRIGWNRCTRCSVLARHEGCGSLRRGAGCQC